MKTSWIDYLSPSVAERLGNCCNRRSDLRELVDARWKYYKDTGKNYVKEDALIYVLEHLDCNGQCFDLSNEEYNNLCKGE